MLKATLDPDTFNELDEAQQAFYREDGDHYVLAVEDIEEHPAIAKMKENHGKLLKNNRNHKERLESFETRVKPLLEAFEDEDMDFGQLDHDRLEAIVPFLKGEADHALAPGAELPKEKGKEIDLDKIKQNARKPLERENEKLKERNEQLETHLQRHIVDAALSDAIASVGVKHPPYVQAVKAMFRNQVKVQQGDDGSLQAVIDSPDYGEQSVKAYMKEWASSDDGKAFTASPGNSGGSGDGARGGTNGQMKNPFMKDVIAKDRKWAVAEQNRLMRENPEMGRQMAKAAGFPLAG